MKTFLKILAIVLFLFGAFMALIGISMLFGDKKDVGTGMVGIVLFGAFPILCGIFIWRKATGNDRGSKHTVVEKETERIDVPEKTKDENKSMKEIGVSKVSANGYTATIKMSISEPKTKEEAKAEWEQRKAELEANPIPVDTSTKGKITKLLNEYNIDYSEFEKAKNNLQKNNSEIVTDMDALDVLVQHILENVIPKDNYHAREGLFRETFDLYKKEGKDSYSYSVEFHRDKFKQCQKLGFKKAEIHCIEGCSIFEKMDGAIVEVVPCIDNLPFPCPKDKGCSLGVDGCSCWLEFHVG
ncbi:MAG: DUF308 domain-containing protein [Leptospirales bacterium]|nr:DUF308 domain-containing protein [Leptospirales bacterium]